MRKCDGYDGLSEAEKFSRKYNQNIKRNETFCYVTFRNKVKAKCISSGRWGHEDVMYWFEDGSMILERVIVKEFQLFKA